MPNWEDASAYRFTEKLSRDGWAWEFLRRNPEYSEAWEKAEAGFRRHPDSAGFSTEELAKLGFPHYQIPFWPAPSRWGFKHFLNPERTWAEFPRYARWKEFRRTAGWLYVGRGPERFEGGQTVGISLPEGRAAFVFDLRVQLAPQLKEARESLLGWQKYRETKGLKVQRLKHQPDNWCLYLRLLDARAAGAGRDRMAAVLWDSEMAAPEQDRNWVDGRMKVALELMRGGYLRIVGLPSRRYS